MQVLLYSDIVILLVTIYPDGIFLISPSTTRNTLKFWERYIDRHRTVDALKIALGEFSLTANLPGVEPTHLV